MDGCTIVVTLKNAVLNVQQVEHLALPFFCFAPLLAGFLLFVVFYSKKKYTFKKKKYRLPLQTSL